MKTKLQRAFSLVEVLAAIAVIGIITYMAIPNIVRVKQDSETGLALSRASSLNMAMASYSRDLGTAATWSNADTNACYSSLRTYLGFAPSTFAEFQPLGYRFDFPATLSTPVSVYITNGARTVVVY